MKAWNGWYHVNGNTYGTWLRGDPRGWRARWHREHVEGDYKKPPPPGIFDTLYQQSKRLLKTQPVRLRPSQQVAGGRAFVEKLIELDVEVLSFALDAIHYHFLARFPDGEVRQRVGKAKKNASHILRAYDLPGTVWAKKCRALPVSDRRHQVNVFRYIVNHRKAHAWVWTFREGMYWLNK